jgi:hypothetical protein
MIERLRTALAGLAGRLPAEPPIVVGATGGSGTRAVCFALAEAGVHMGRPERLNGAGDAMAFEPWLDATINPVLEATRSLDYRLADLPAALAGGAVRRLRGIVARHAGSRPATAPGWGWKNPRSMYLLPVIRAVVPEVRFVHLIRDGRDMALSSNQNQARKHAAALLGLAAPATDPVTAIRLWAEANGAVADWGERELGAHYLRVRFEDLCAAPAATIGRILALLPNPALTADGMAERAAAGVTQPETAGRWQAMPAADLRDLEAAASGVLARFGYLDGPSG